MKKKYYYKTFVTIAAENPIINTENRKKNFRKTFFYCFLT